VPGRHSPAARTARAHRRVTAPHLPRGHLRGLNVAAMYRALVTAVCCPLRSHLDWPLGLRRRESYAGIFRREPGQPGSLKTSPLGVPGGRTDGESWPGSRNSRRPCTRGPGAATAGVYSWVISQANVTATTAPSTGNPTRKPTSSRHTGSRRRKNFGRGRLTTTALSATSSSSFTRCRTLDQRTPDSRRPAPRQCPGTRASGPHQPVARPRRTRRTGG
jgi:hypothetical protein